VYHKLLYYFPPTFNDFEVPWN